MFIQHFSLLAIKALATEDNKLTDQLITDKQNDTVEFSGERLNSALTLEDLGEFRSLDNPYTEKNVPETKNSKNPNNNEMEVADTHFKSGDPISTKESEPDTTNSENVKETKTKDNFEKDECNTENPVIFQCGDDELVKKI